MNLKYFRKVTFSTFAELENHLNKGWTAWVAVPYEPDGHYVTAVSIKTETNAKIVQKFIIADDPLNGSGIKYLLNTVKLQKSWAIIV